MAKITVEIEILTDNIRCSGRSLNSITGEIDNCLSDAFKDISLYRQKGNEHPLIDTLEEVEGYLCKIQELIGLIK